MQRAIHPFPARMAPEIATDAIKGASRPLRILDPMCGSGTVLTEAVAHGHSAVGYDLDPLAVLMSRVATAHTDDTAGLEALAIRCVSAARRSRALAAPWMDAETTQFAHYWFAESQYRQLVRLALTLSRLEDGPARDALQVALSRTIVTKTPQASLAADTAHSRPHRVALTSTYDVYEGFLRSTHQLLRRLPLAAHTGHAVVKMADARDPAAHEPESFDLVVTSPPYLNAIDYLRGHRLALIWLGHSVAHLRRIRAVAIGSEARRGQREVGTTTEEVLTPLLADARHPETLPTHLLERYTNDMQTLAVNINRCLVPGGAATIVVADSILRGNDIPTGKIVTATLQRAGLLVERTVTREIPSGSRYLPVNNAGPNLGRRMKSEYVITARKAEG